MPSYVARPHVLADEFVPGYLGDSFGLFPFVHGDPLANQFDGPFLVRLIRKEVTHIFGFPFGIESRDPDIPSCWHSGTMRRSCCWSIPCHNQANPLPTNDTPASDIPQRFQCPAMLGDGGVGNRKVRYRSARIPSPPSRGGALRPPAAACGACARNYESCSIPECRLARDGIRAGQRPSGSDFEACGSARPARGVPIPILCRSGWPRVLWSRYHRPIPSRGRLRRSRIVTRHFAQARRDLGQPAGISSTAAGR